MNENLSNLIIEIETIINSIQEQTFDIALANIIRFIDDFSSCDYENLQIGEINKALKNVVEGLEKQDFILISDVFEYEILPLLQEN